MLSNAVEQVLDHVMCREWRALEGIVRGHLIMQTHVASGC